jgi:hypothetical protein
MIRRFLAGSALSMFAIALIASSASAARITTFVSPSGNIGCVMTGNFARCDIKEHSWPTPPKPSSCDVDYGQGVAVGKHGRASYVCAGDTAFDLNADTLGYGDRVSQRLMRCSSKSKGMRCVNRRTRHGFFLSRADVRLF